MADLISRQAKCDPSEMPSIHLNVISMWGLGKKWINLGAFSLVIGFAPAGSFLMETTVTGGPETLGLIFCGEERMQDSLCVRGSWIFLLVLIPASNNSEGRGGSSTTPCSQLLNFYVSSRSPVPFLRLSSPWLCVQQHTRPVPMTDSLILPACCEVHSPSQRTAKHKSSLNTDKQ
jgi:hypothetical protein